MPNKRQNSRNAKQRKSNQRRNNNNNRNRRAQNAPVAISSGFTTGGPQFMPTPGHDAIRIRHRELLGPALTGTGNGNNIGRSTAHTTFLTPTNGALFPWLSRIAPNWDYYRFNSVAVCFSSAIPTTTGGKIYMAFDRDPNDVVTNVNIQQMMANLGARDGPLWKDLKIVLRDKTFRLVDIGNTITARDTGAMILHEPANLLIAALSPSFPDDGATAVNIGDLYIEYDVEFKMPSMTPVVVGTSSSLADITVLSAFGPGGATVNDPFAGATIGGNMIDIAASVAGELVFGESWIGTIAAIMHTAAGDGFIAPSPVGKTRIDNLILTNDSQAGGASGFSTFLGQVSTASPSAASLGKLMNMAFDYSGGTATGVNAISTILRFLPAVVAGLVPVDVEEDFLSASAIHVDCGNIGTVTCTDPEIFKAQLRAHASDIRRNYHLHYIEDGKPVLSALLDGTYVHLLHKGVRNHFDCSGTGQKYLAAVGVALSDTSGPTSEC